GYLLARAICCHSPPSCGLSYICARSLRL
ncbi:unnamed protein product, partial [Rhizoctonia solani]